MTRAALVSAFVAVLAATPALAQDLLIHGGPIHTGVDGAPVAEAVLVRDGRIAWVGAEDERPATPAEIETIDLQGAALFPGFTDGHAHLDGIGWRETTLNLEGAASLAEAMQRVRDWAAAHPEGPVVGRGWIETHWPEGRTPNAWDLEDAAPGRVVLLGRADGHAVVVSPAALNAAAINVETRAPDGGEIARDEDGHATGLLVDAAMALVEPLMPQADEAARLNAYREGFRVEAAYGWTGIHFMSAPWADIPLLEGMAERGEATLRVYNAVTPDGAEALFASGPRSVADGRVITRAVKYYADGALGSRGAALFEPYADAPGTTGLMQTSEAEVGPLYQRALRSGIQIATHAIGDRANADVATWYMDAMEAVPEVEWANGHDVRWRIEHAQIIHPRWFDIFLALPIIASMQPSHAIGDLHFAPARLGDERLDGAYAWRTLTDLGVIVVGGSDAPVERGDPLIEFYAAVYRHDLNGFQGPDWRAGQVVSRETALKMFTLWPAYASFREDELGTIEVGKRADFTAFSVDLMTAPVADIPRAHAVLTVVDGEVVYRRD